MRHGGCCGYAVSNGDVAPIDPAVERIDDGKLYLGYNAAIHRNRAREIPGFIGWTAENSINILKLNDFMIMPRFASRSGRRFPAGDAAAAIYVLILTAHGIGFSSRLGSLVGRFWG